MGHLIPFTQNHPLLVGAAIALVIALIVDELVRRVQGKSDLGSHDAVRLINQGAAVVDLRSAGDFRTGHINQARNVPADELEDQLDKLGKDGHGVLLYCSEGKEGAKAARQLAARGVERAFNLKGGFATWKHDNLPVAKGKN